MWRDDAGCTEVEYFLDRQLLSSGEAHHAGYPVADRLKDALYVAVAQGAVLGVYEQPVETEVGEDLRRGRSGKRYHRAE